jgi:hypothetical protein
MGVRVNAITTARGELHAAMLASAAVHQPWRIHQWAPDQIVAPCIYLGNPTLDRQTMGSPGVDVVVATFPIYCVADGKPGEQSKTLDDMTAFAWDAVIAAGGLPDATRPTPIDVGGPSLRGVSVQAEITLRAVTLCAPSLEGATSG